MTRVGWASLPIALAGLAAAAFGWASDPHAFFPAWLAACVFVAAWPLGSMALLLTHELTGGRWGDVLRPSLLTGVCALPLLLVAAIPLAIGLPDIYAWARPDAHPPNAFYLNTQFFAWRCAIYLVVWCALGTLILRGAGRTIAPFGLFILAVTVSFAAIDTIMSLDPRFNSSIFGMMTASGMALLALSMAVLLSAAAGIPEALRADLAKLLLALVILWIYLDFMQLLIVWQSDLAHEAPWYLDRSRGAWGAIRIVIALGHFVLPLALLISPRLQRSRLVIVCVAALLVSMEALRAWWSILPSLHLFIGWIDLACMAGVAGSAFAVAVSASSRPFSRRPLRHV